MDTVQCPKCGHENAFLRIVDETGAHYECPDCDPEYEWCDTSMKAEAENDEDDESFKMNI
mgnify:CR=1 FL=1